MFILKNNVKLFWLLFIGASAFSFAQEEEINPALVINEAFNQYANLYQDNCAVCHGDQLQGAAQGAPLLGELKHGATQSDIELSIMNGYAELGMPAWSNALSQEQIRFLALFVTESRAGLSYQTFNNDASLEIPRGVITSEVEDFRLETVIDNLDPLPFSIAPLPDGRILLTEKAKGLRIVNMDGTRSDYISGTPQTYDDGFILLDSVQQVWGYGWMNEVALHPDYIDNGWIYLAYGDRCSDCNELSRNLQQDVSMFKVVRGRILNGAWVDEQTIWESDVEHYGTMPEVVGGGRLAFDEEGHMFISVGMKGASNFEGIQDLSTPWGKIHRVYLDGSIPTDNPFYDQEGVYKSIWTYGHRSPQGLEYRKSTGELWETENGPRGGDEINLLSSAKNYGWPLHSLGMNYDGTEVAYAELLGIDLETVEIEKTVVDLTPSPAVSTFVFYEGDEFPQWRDQMIVGSLKAQSLYRIVLENGELIHQETLLSSLARIRDIELGFQGELYLLLENNGGSQIVRMLPADN